jgi:NAD(P)H-flavin reductase
MLPEIFRVTKRKKELADTWTLELEPGRPFAFRPGQFNMVYVFGIGEVPISISGDAAETGVLVHTIRAVGKVSAAMCAARPGTSLGVRGPFGTAWPMEAAEGGDVVVIAGGIGLAPLRPAIRHLVANRSKYGRVVVLYGGRTPETLLFAGEFRRWRSRFDIEAEVTVDAAGTRWRGHVGVVTKLVNRVTFDPEKTTGLVCGPEIMMRFAVGALQERGVAPAGLYVSMERNMKCAVGFCGHCQFGPEFVCKDGPVFPFRRIENTVRIREI